MLSKSNWEK